MEDFEDWFLMIFVKSRNSVHNANNVQQLLISKLQI